MVLWVDKYRPKSLDKLEIHTAVSARLQKIVRSGDFPHMLIYGPSGAGKKTRILALLRELYGPGVEKVKVNHKAFKIKTKTVEISTISSMYHIEMNPSEAGINDTHVVQEVIKELAATQTLKTSSTSKAFKVVVLNEVDRLSLNAQHALRRTMEKYMSTCRIILCCESACRVSGPLRSRCLGIRLPSPDVPSIVTALENVARKERLQLPAELATRIAVESGRSLRKALLSLEACKVSAGSTQLNADEPLRRPDWESFIESLAAAITEEQTPQRLLLARAKVYELLANCIPADVILKKLTVLLLRRLDDQLKHEVTEWAAHYEHRMKCGNKEIFHIEAFIAKFMSLYKTWIQRNFG